MPYVHAAEDGGTALRNPTIALGGFALALLAGYVNASVLSFYEIPVSHMSGAITRLGMDLGLGLSDELATLGSIIGSFFLGAILSGVIIGRDQLRPGYRYGVVLGLESLALVASAALLNAQRPSGIFCAALACGMQNAMASSYYGLIIRTTHMTGIVTDLGALIGHALRHRQVDRWKFLFLGLILGGFTSGALASVVLNRWSTEFFSGRLYLAAIFCALIAVAQVMWTSIVRRSPQGEDPVATKRDGA